MSEEPEAAGQDRKLILLDEWKSKPEQRILKILESPLGLATEIAVKCFSMDDKKSLLSFREDLDILKKMGFGLASSIKRQSYPVANYASYLFAYQQFIQSSYRARQGNFVESVIRAILEDTDVTVFEKRNHTEELKKIIGGETSIRHDIDVMARHDDEELVVQVRSRDDTGGTTAKGSLVELLKDLLRNDFKLKVPIRYVVYIWVEGNGGQKSTLITKMADQLRGLSKTNDFDQIREKLSKGERVNLSSDISLELVYGIDEFSEILMEFSKNNEIKTLSKKILETLEDWDDLWLTYAVASMELQNMIISGVNNFKILNEKLAKIGISLGLSDYKNYDIRADEIGQKLMKEWSENSLPVYSPKDQFQYVKDLIFIKMIADYGSQRLKKK